jgi:GTP-binding protein LepA
MQLGVFSPKPVPVDELGVGEVGFVVANIKTVATRRSATRSPRRPADARAVPRLQGAEADGVRRLYPVEGHRVRELREALEKLRLNDASFFYEPRRRPRSASGSAAASSACCTWRSCRSGSSASSTWTW